MADDSAKSFLEEQLTMGEKIPVGFPWRLFLFSFIIFLMTGGVYLGLTAGYGPLLKSQIERLDAEIKNNTQAIPEEEQKNFARIYSRSINLKILLDNHIRGSRIFTFLEKYTHQRVYYASLNISTIDKKISLSATAPSFDVIASQLLIFQQAPEVKKATIGALQPTKGGSVNFPITLILADDFFK